MLIIYIAYVSNKMKRPIVNSLIKILPLFIEVKQPGEKLKKKSRSIHKIFTKEPSKEN